MVDFMKTMQDVNGNVIADSELLNQATLNSL